MSKTIDSIALFCKEGTSDKEYHVLLVEDAGGYLVNFLYGRRGSTLRPGTKTEAPVTQEAARKIYNSVVKGQFAKGYTPGGASGSEYVAPASQTMPSADRIPQLPTPITTEEELEKYLRDETWGAQEKKDGKHLMVSRTASDTITATNKKGIETGYPAVYATALDMVGLYDGESIGDAYHLFDLLKYGSRDLRPLGYLKRYEFLAGIVRSAEKTAAKVVPLAIGYAAKKALLDKLRAGKKEGIVFKRLDAPFKAGKAHSDMVKFKFYAEASCIVAPGRDGKRSVGLELIDDAGKRVSVGNVTIPPNKDIPAVGSVLEVVYLYAYKGGSVYQAHYGKVRDDVDVSECLMTQLKYKAEED
jgi:bifunctional non-homologous end joining protein LigD